MKVKRESVEIRMAELGMSFKELSDSSSVSLYGLRNILKGKTSPYPATVGRIAKALDINIEELIYRE